MVDAHGFIGNEHSSAWLWLLWHISFPLIVIYGMRDAEATHDPPPRGGIIVRWIAGCVAVAGAAALSVTVGRGGLPSLVHHGAFSPLFTTLSIVAAVANLFGVARLARLRWPPSIFSVWLMVALLAAAFDTSLNALTAVRYSAAWYVGKLDTLISASIVLVSLLAAWSAMYARSAALARELAGTLADGRALQARLSREHEIRGRPAAGVITRNAAGDRRADAACYVSGRNP